MPRRASKDRWHSTTYAYGYVELRKGSAYCCYKGQRKSTGLAFVPKNKRAALEMLDAWIFEIEFPEKALVQKIGDGMSLSKALGIFHDRRWESFTPAVRDNYDRAFNAYCIRDASFDSVDEVATMLAHRDRELDLGRNTRNLYLRYLSLFFEDCVSSELITANPVRRIGVPSRVGPAEILMFSLDEVRAICTEIVKAPGDPEYGMLIRWLAITGMRIHETLNLRWADITDIEIRIVGKGRRARVIPIRLLPKLRALIEELRYHQPSRSARVHGGRAVMVALPESERKVFRWKNDTIIRTRFNNACQAAGIDRCEGERTLHNLRGTAGWWMETELGLEERVMCDLLGQEPSTRRRFYRTRPTAADLEKRTALRTLRTGKSQV